ncbi:ABC transporter permease [Burkholderia sp. MR1-5-21]
MKYVAVQMLFGDRAKLFGLVFSLAFASFLLMNQTSIFAGIMARTGSQILDVADAPVWVMDPKTPYADEIAPMTDNQLFRVRGVDAVSWAVPLYKGSARAKAADGTFRQCVLMGVDDATLTGAVRKIVLGSMEVLRQPDTIVIDKAGYGFFFPGQPLQLGRTLEMNDHRVIIGAISDAGAPFTTFPVIYARYSLAVQLIGRESRYLSVVLAAPKPGVSPEQLAERISRATGLRAATQDGFFWQTMHYYLRNTGIPVNFGITIAIALIVGTVVAGQTFYIFTIENLRQFGALKAIGVSNRRLIGLIVLQALIVAAIGYGLGLGLCATFFEVTLHQTATRGIILMWQSAVGVGVVIFVVVILASLLSIRKVLLLEPAIVFRA